MSTARVPEARVTIVNEDTGATRLTLTSAEGEYHASLLPPGTYAVRIEKMGFRTAVEEHIRVEVQQTARQDVVLQVGEFSQRVVVSGDAPLVNADTPQIGYVIGQRDANELPLNQRNFLEFALLVPGAGMPAEGSQNIGTGGSFSVNGAREQSNNFLLNGIDNNDPMFNQYSTLPPVESIEEFRVQASNSSAEFGRTAGAQINIVLKSGTNQFHGSTFEFLRNRNLDAKNFFDRPDCTAASAPGTCAPIPGLDRSQFGGSLGGPIRHDRTFFDVTYEGLILRQASTRQATVPSQQQRQAALAAVPASRLSQAGLDALNLYPAANAGTNLSQSNLLVSSPIATNRGNQGVAKIDHQLGASDTLSAVYAIFDQTGYDPFNRKFIFTNLPGYGSDSALRGQNVALTWTKSASRGFINKAQIGLNRHQSAVLQQDSGVPRNREIGFPDTSSDPVDWGYPNIALSGFDGIGTSIILPQDYVSNTFEYSDDAVWNPAFNGGRHQFKFGVDVRRIQQNFFLDALKRGEWLFTGAFTHSPLTDLLSGLPTIAITGAGDTHTGLRATGLGFYSEDRISLGSRLALEVGLRYDYNSPATDIHDRLSVPDLSAASASCAPKPACQFIPAGTGGVPHATYNGLPHDFSPRAGFAWRPFASNQVVVRGGYGIYYDAGLLNVNLLPRSNPPFYSVTTFANRGTSNIQTIVQPSAVLPAPVQSVMISPSYRDGYMEQWNLTLERQLGQDVLISAAYVGSRGLHLLEQNQGNQSLPGGLPPYPQFGAIRLITSDASSVYHSLQLHAEKRFRKGLSFLAAYTWSKSLDNASSLFGAAGDPAFPQNAYDLRAEWGLSDFNAAHRFVLSSIFDAPARPASSSLRAARLVNAALGGWQISPIVDLQTGSPFTVNRGVSQSGTGVSLGFLDRPDAIANPFVAGPVMSNPDQTCHATTSQGGRAADVTGVPSIWFNPCAFAAPATPGFGNEGRNALTGPGFASVDLGLVKRIPLPDERGQLDFRAGFFNLFNHPNLDLPNQNFDSPAVGAVQSANAFGNKPPRQIQLGLRYTF